MFHRYHFSWRFRIWSREVLAGVFRDADTLLDQDLVHWCRGRRLQNVWAFRFRKFQQFVSVLHFDMGVSWHCVCFLSCASWKPWFYVHYLCGSHLWCWRLLLCEYCLRARIVFHKVTSEYDQAFVFLRFRLWLRSLVMTDIHQRSKMDRSLLFLCHLDDLSFALYFNHGKCWQLIELLHFLSTAAFASGILIAWSTGTNLCTRP